MVAMSADSFELAMGNGAVHLRAARGALSVQRDLGFNRKKGAAVGAAIIGGGMATWFLVESGGEAVAAPEFYIFVGGFAAMGALTAALLTPRRWESLSSARECPAYRIMPGSKLTLHTADGRDVRGRVVEHRVDSIAIVADSATEAVWVSSVGARAQLSMARSRLSGALVWGGVGALVIGALYAASPPDQREGGLAGILGLAQYPALIGAIRGGRPIPPSPLPRC